MAVSDAFIKVQVDPLQMWTSGNFTIPAYANSVADSINNIVKVWNDLKGNWLGATADEAQAFDDTWSKSITALFGSKDQPDAGILSKIAVLLGIAASNYDNTETAMRDMFAKFLGQIEAVPSSAPDPSRNNTQGPIWETSG